MTTWSESTTFKTLLHCEFGKWESARRSYKNVLNWLETDWIVSRLIWWFPDWFWSKNIFQNLTMVRKILIRLAHWFKKLYAATKDLMQSQNVNVLTRSLKFKHFDVKLLNSQNSSKFLMFFVKSQRRKHYDSEVIHVIFNWIAESIDLGDFLARMMRRLFVCV